jgi:hypothetical protein
MIREVHHGLDNAAHLGASLHAATQGLAPLGFAAQRDATPSNAAPSRDFSTRR